MSERITNTSSALGSIKNRDTLDVISPRLRGTSAFVTRVSTMGALPSAAVGLLQEGGQHFIGFDAPLYVAGGALVSTLAYGGKRLIEGRHLQHAESAQQFVRDELREPVDIIRTKKRRLRRKKQDDTELTLRWHGADAVKPQTLDRFKKVVDFAATHDISDLVVSTELFELGDRDTLIAQYDKNLTTTQQLFRKEKGVSITDRKTSSGLVRLTVDDAYHVIKQLTPEASRVVIRETTRLEALAELFVSLAQSSQFKDIYQKWQDIKRAEEIDPSIKAELLKPSVKNVMRFYLERKLGQGFSEPVDVRIGSSTINVPSSFRVTVTPEGILRQYTPREDFGPETNVSSEYQSHERFLGGNITQALEGFFEKKSESVVKLKHKIYSSDEQLKLADCIYYLLTHPQEDKGILLQQDAVVASSSVSQSLQVADTTETFYSRVAKERPRTKIVWPHLPQRGTFPSDEQTVEYGKRPKKLLAKKAAALTVAGVIGYVSGSILGTEAVHTAKVEEANHCASSSSHHKTEKEKIACGTIQATISGLFQESTHDFYQDNAHITNTLQTMLYKSGMPFIQPSGLSSGAWAIQRQNSINNHINIYGGSTAEVGDVQTNTDFSVWQLRSLNRARTNGYWPTNVQDNITVFTAAHSQNSNNMINRKPTLGQLPPFSDLQIQFDSPAESTNLAPFGVNLSSHQTMQHVRELEVPTSLSETTQPLIEVTGQQALAGEPERVIWHDKENRKGSEWQVYSLPVLQGSDIVAANIVVRDLGTDKVINNPRFIVYQRTDGTFQALIPDSTQPKGYVSIQYWIEPHASTEYKLHALKPMTASFYGEKSEPVSTVVNQSEANKLDTVLGLPSDAKAEQIAAKISQNHAYTLAPYNKGNPTVVPSEKIPLDKILARVSQYAIDLPALDCNVADESESIASRGITQDGFEDAVTGFHISGGTSLSQLDSHIYSVTNTGETVDPTPVDANNMQQKIENPTQPPTSNNALLEEIEAFLTLTALESGLYGAQPVVRRRNSRKAFEYFEKDDPELERDIRIVQQLLYGEERFTLPYNDGVQEEDKIKAETRTGKERMHTTVPQVDRSEARKLVKGRILSKKAKRRVKEVLLQRNRVDYL